MFHEDDVRQKRMHFRRSQSPVEREFESRGGGQASRNRSPGHGRRDGERPRDNGYGDRSGPRERYDDRSPQPRDRDTRGNGRPRDEGYGGRSRRDDEYGPKERELERQRDRERFDANARGEDEKPSIEPEKPNFAASGLLAKETNTVKGVELKYNEPPEARKPLKNWRLYVFKGKEQLGEVMEERRDKYQPSSIDFADLIHIYKQSAYLVGRDQVVTDIPIAHPSCSKQHAVIQYRQITEKNEYGEVSASVKPFIIDLDSTNGTHVNDEEIPKSRYYELRNSDVIKFGTSSREYVLLHEDAA